MINKTFTYKKSGVNIDAADKFVNFISKISSKKKGNKKFNNIGGFGSISNIPKEFKRPKIVACTDGVGTKVEIANLLNKYDKSSTVTQVYVVRHSSIYSFNHVICYMS